MPFKPLNQKLTTFAGERTRGCVRALLLIVSALCTGQPQAYLPPGASVRERTMSRDDVERLQLPPSTAWNRFRVDVPKELTGFLVEPPPAGGWAFYARKEDGNEWCVVSQSTTAVICSDQQRVVEIERVQDSSRQQSPASPRWWFFRRGMALECGGCLLFETLDPSEWEFYWLNPAEEKPAVQKLYRADLEDRFMRLSFAEDDRWTVHSGDWQLKQYGGGMPTNESEARNPNYRRASNAFSLLGADGEASYGRETWVDLQAEARFSFGRPGSYAKRDTLVEVTLGGEPTYADKDAIYKSNQIQEYPEGDFFVAHGLSGGARAAFGWCQDKSRFQLRVQYPGEAEWRVVRQWDIRPYYGNWVRMGIGVSRGVVALPFLDGEQLGAFPLGVFVRGPVTLISGKGKVEVDDIKAWSFPQPTDLGAPVFEQSANFAQKELLATKDKQTGQWTRSELTFEEDEARVRGKDMHLQRCQFPIFGDFTYRASPELPIGDYCLAIVNDRERPFFQSFFTRTDEGWTNAGGREPDFELEICRRKGRIARRVGGEWELLTSRRVSSTAWLVIGSKDDSALDPVHHRIFSRCLTHDLFEEAPSDWAWTEGNFRMDVRWQCQRGWNFMMGKSRDVAAMYTKTDYSGDQEIEFYIALRFVTPPPYYVLRDMGFAFCTDGKSLASGYTLVYGDADNTKTTLLRKGKPVGEVDAVIKHKPGGNIHNYWWHGKVCKRGRRITVDIDDQRLFDFTDASPIEGGHVAFWTFRNAISLAKVSINAESVEPRPELFRLPDRRQPAKRGWQALNPDQVSVKSLASGNWRVENRVGGNTFAVRCTFPGDGVDLRDEPWVLLPLKCDRQARVGIHLQISGESFYYPYTSSTEQLRYLLTPQFEELEPEKIYRQKLFTADDVRAFQIPGRHTSSLVTLDLRELVRTKKLYRLQSITIGNSSNHQYLVLGAGGNGPGATYTVGKPKWRG